MKTLTRIRFNSISNHFEWCDILIDYKEGDGLYIYLPQLSIHRQYQIDSYYFKLTYKDTEETLIVNPFDLLACQEIKYKEGLYYEYYKNTDINLDDVGAVRIEAWVEVDGAYPDWMEEEGSGVLQPQNNIINLKMVRSGSYININLTKDTTSKIKETLKKE